MRYVSSPVKQIPLRFKFRYLAKELFFLSSLFCLRVRCYRELCYRLVQAINAVCDGCQDECMNRSWGTEISLLGKWSWDQLSHLTEGRPWTVNTFEQFCSCTIFMLGITQRASWFLSHSQLGSPPAQWYKQDSFAERRNSSWQNQGRARNGCMCFETSLIQGILWQCN